MNDMCWEGSPGREGLGAQGLSRASILLPPLIFLSLIFIVGCGGDPAPEYLEVRAEPSIPTALGTCLPEAPAPEVEEVAFGLETPWAMVQAPDGRIFLTERPGRIRVVGPEGLEPEPWAVLEIYEEGELGLMGIALSPEFAEDQAVYVMGRFLAESERRLSSWITPLVRRVRAMLRRHDEGSRYVSHIYRLAPAEGGGVARTRVVSGIPAAAIHGGGALAFLPGGTLLYSVGDALIPWSAQDRRRVPGKILRRSSEPGVQGEPPRVPEEVAASGVRNSQGIALHRASGTTLFIDHGPTGLEPELHRQNSDELNVLEESGNYGWPVEAGALDDARFLEPLVDWTPAIAPAGLAIQEESEPDPGRIVAYVSSLRGQALHRLELVRASEDGPWQAVCEDRLLEGEYGRFRAVMAGRDGDVYVSTSNRDGRGRIREGDDRLLRVRLPKGRQ